MPDNEMIHVRYVANSNGSTSGGLTFTEEGDDRETLWYGQEGYVTPQEMGVAANAGVVLEVVDENVDNAPASPPAVSAPLSAPASPAVVAGASSTAGTSGKGGSDS